MNNYRYINKQEKLEILKSGNLSKILRDYNYGNLTHYYTSEPFDKSDPLSFYDSQRIYKLNLLSDLVLKYQLDEELISIIKKTIPNLNYDTQAGHYYNIGFNDDYKKVTDIFAKMMIQPQNFHYNNQEYISSLFNNENFYKDKPENSNFQFKDFSKKENKNIDFGKYAFISGNPLALNFIYLELKSLKKTYQEFVYKELSFSQFSSALQHYKNKNDWPNIKNEKIKSIDSLFYNIDFILLFAINDKNLNKNQKSILEFILKDKKLLEKLQNNAGKNQIYTKINFDKLNSKDIFLIATIKKNYDLINILLKSGYQLNNNEKAILSSPEMKNKIENFKIEVDNIDIVTQNIMQHISNNSIKNSDIVYNFSDKDMNSIQEYYDSFKHSVSFNKTISLNKKIDINDLYFKKIGTIIDSLVIKNPYHLPALYNKGFKNIHPKIEYYVFNNLLIPESKYNFYQLSKNSVEDSLLFIDIFLNKQKDNGEKLIHLLFSNIDSSNPFISPLFDFFVANKISNINYSKEEIFSFSTSSLAIFNTLTKIEKENFYGDELPSYINNFTDHYLELLSDKSKLENINDNHIHNIIMELVKLSIDNNFDISSYIKNQKDTRSIHKYNEIIINIEKEQLKVITNNSKQKEFTIKRRI